MATFVCASAVLAACALLVGCGGAEEPEDVVARFFDMVIESDAATNEQALVRADAIMAELFTAEARESAELKDLVVTLLAMGHQSEFQDLEYELVNRGEDSVRVRNAYGMVLPDASGMSVRVEVTGYSTLKQEQGSWRIDSME